MTNLAPNRSFGFYVDGAWRIGSGGSFGTINPVNGQESATFSIPDQIEIDEIVKKSRESIDSRVWSNMKWHERARVLDRVAAVMDARVDELAAAQSIGNGKTLKECRAQAQAAADVFRYYASVAETFETSVTTQRTQSLTLELNEPVGLVLAITPWNSPLTLEAQKLAPILAGGNSVILKPSEITPHVSIVYAGIFVEAGIPENVVNIVLGDGSVGEQLVNSPAVDLITFTGGTAAGRAIAEAAGRRLCPVILELGGKSPNIVLSDADLELASKGCANGIFSGGGQSCIAGSRILINSAIYDDFKEIFCDLAEAFRFGLPDDQEADYGAMATFKHRDSVHSMVQSAVSEGGSVDVGGYVPDISPYSKGAFYPATVISDLQSNSTLCQEEAFGPVCVLQKFDTNAELLQLANGTQYGLAAGIWTRSAKQAWHVAREVRAGTVWINTYKELSISTPFGGFKSSGMWREKGRQGISIYLERKGIYWNFDNS
jgi:betaine-aldehyde dehydrogenase